MTNAPPPSTPATAPAKTPGCGIGCAAVIVIIIVAIAIGSMSRNQAGSAGTDGTSDTSSQTTDPVEQARVVLEQNYGESYDYAAIKTATDAALTATGETVSDDTRSRAWSAVLASIKQPELSAVSPMGVMQCVAREGVGSAGAGMGFAEMAAICAVLLM